MNLLVNAGLIICVLFYFLFLNFESEWNVFKCEISEDRGMFCPSLLPEISYEYIFNGKNRKQHEK